MAVLIFFVVDVFHEQTFMEYDDIRGVVRSGTELRSCFVMTMSALSDQVRPMLKNPAAGVLEATQYAYCAESDSCSTWDAGEGSCRDGSERVVSILLCRWCAVATPGLNSIAISTMVNMIEQEQVCVSPCCASHLVVG